MRFLKILFILGLYIITPNVLFAQKNLQSKAESIYEDLTENVEKIDSVASATEARINTVFDSIRSLKKYINILDSSRIISLPVGLPNVLKSPNYDIAITQANFHTGGATFNASMMIINPFDGKRLCFEAQNVPFSYSGGMSGDARLLLVSEKSFKICNGVRMFVLPGSFVEFNCNGFKSLTLKGKVVLSGKTFVKVNASGDSISGPIEAYFETTINDWNNLFLSLNNIDPFRLRNVPDVSFACNNLTIDYSDYRNPDNINFPESYAGNFPDGSINLWRGVYIQRAFVSLDRKFSKKDSTKLTTFEAKELLIDDYGLTGELSATNLININEGQMDKWGFSLERFNMKLQANRIETASFAGQVHIPSFKDSLNFSYNAFIDTDGFYNFTVTNNDTIDFEVFGNSKLTINESSYISITVENGKFKPVANFSGSMNIDVSGMKMADIRFENLRIASEAPYLSVQSLAIDGGSQGTFSRFPLTVNDIRFSTSDKRISLSLDVKLNLMNSEDEGFSGLCDISMFAKAENYKYKFDGIQVNEIRVDVVKDGAYEIHGQIMFARGDSIYGDGFRGKVKAKFSTIEIQALAVFGNVSGTRYFFVDAFLGKKPGIQAGPITIYGFSGGLYYHMKQKEGVVNENSFGASLSGLVYEPNPKIGIGILAGVKFGVIKEQIIDADVKFEIVFTPDAGLDRIYFEGNAKCIVPKVDIVPDKIKLAAQKFAKGEELPFAPTDAALTAKVVMDMNFGKQSFHSLMEMYVNVGPIIKGVGANGRAGWCEMHFDPDIWYIHAGSPKDPIGLKFLNLLESKSYFMMGHNLPTELPMNPQVVSILKINPAELSMNRDNSMLQNGNGIAFGSSFRFNTGNLTFLVFYASFDFGAGFDIMLTDYGSKCYCEGHPAPLGINGWYAKGQLYAYLKGEVGIEAKVFKKKRRFEILSLSMATLMRAEAPNPTYLMGIAGGEYKVFGGMIKGNCKFKIEVGEKCNLVKVNSSPAPVDMPVIGDITPEESTNDADVFITPQVVFNIPVNVAFKISDDANITKQYRVKLEKLELVPEGSSALSTILNWNADGSVVSLEPAAILNPKSKYKLNVSISFEELLGNAWTPITENGQAFTESRSVTFTTGQLPDKIPAHAVKYSYPVDRMYNFYKNEYPQAYMAFNRDVAIFFSADADYTRQAQWIDGSGQKLRTTLTYNPSEKTVYTDVPTGLRMNSIYSLNFVAVPRSSNNTSDRNVTNSERNVSLDDSTSINVTEKEAAGTISKAEEKTFCSFYFRTSKYSKFEDKLTESPKQVTGLWDPIPYVSYLYIRYTGSEKFDKFESQGNTNTMPLVRRSAVLSNTPWFTEEVYPTIYKNYSYIIKRDTSVSGMPPYKDITLGLTNSDLQLSDSETQTGVVTSNVAEWYLYYKLPYHWSNDYYTVRNYIAYQYPQSQVADSFTAKMLENFRLRTVKPGDYPVKFEYILPGKNMVTTTKYIIYKSPFKTDYSDL